MILVLKCKMLSIQLNLKKNRYFKIWVRGETRQKSRGSLVTAVFALTHMPEARASKTGFRQVKIMNEFA